MRPLERPLGTSGLHITQVGFGAWAIGGGGWAYGWGSQDDADSIAAIQHAVRRGINASGQIGGEAKCQDLSAPVVQLLQRVAQRQPAHDVPVEVVTRTFVQVGVAEIAG